jgi:hypothetical protein
MARGLSEVAGAERALAFLADAYQTRLRCAGRAVDEAAERQRLGEQRVDERIGELTQEARLLDELAQRLSEFFPPPADFPARVDPSGFNPPAGRSSRARRFAETNDERDAQSVRAMASPSSWPRSAPACGEDDRAEG